MPEIDMSTLSCLVRRLLNDKKVEEKAKAARIDAETKIAAMIPGPERGQKTVKLPDGSSVTVERGYNYKADFDAVKLALAEMPETPPPIKSKTTTELDVTGYEYYRENNPEVFQILSKHVIATPKKIAVSVKAAK
jgi:hypothetical protein